MEKARVYFTTMRTVGDEEYLRKAGAPVPHCGH